MTDNTERTRAEILADWRALDDEPDISAMIAAKTALLSEALHLDPPPREMWAWVIGAHEAHARPDQSA